MPHRYSVSIVIFLPFLASAAANIISIPLHDVSDQCGYGCVELDVVELTRTVDPNDIDRALLAFRENGNVKDWRENRKIEYPLVYRLYKVSRRGQRHRLKSTFLTSATKSSLYGSSRVFDIKQLLQRWCKQLKTKVRLILLRADDKDVTNGRFRQIYPDQHALIVTTNKRQPTSVDSARRYKRNVPRECVGESTNQNCCLLKKNASLPGIYQAVIISPLNFEMGYCIGHCTPVSAYERSLRQVLFDQDISPNISRCCQPTAFRTDFRFKHLTDTNEIKFTPAVNLIATSCGCL